MTQHGDYLRCLRDQIHELQVLVDEAISEHDREEDERDNWQRRFRSIQGGVS